MLTQHHKFKVIVCYFFVLMIAIMTITSNYTAGIYAAENQEDDEYSYNEQFCVYNEQEFITALAYQNVGDNVEKSQILIKESFTLNQTVTLKNVYVVVSDGVTFTTNKTINVEKNTIISGSGTAMIKRGDSLTGTSDYMLNVMSGANCILENITFDGGAVWNTDSNADGYNEILGYVPVTTSDGITANAGIITNAGTLTMNSGAILQNNYSARTSDSNTNCGSAGIYNASTGTLTMNQGSSIQYTAGYCGGVYNLGSFVLNGSIKNTDSNAVFPKDKGSTVFTYKKFIMNDGASICNNTSNFCTVAVYYEFYMYGGVIDHNKSPLIVYGRDDGTTSKVYLFGGKLSNNICNGAVSYRSVDRLSVIQINGVEIAYNTGYGIQANAYGLIDFYSGSIHDNELGGIYIQSSSGYRNYANLDMTNDDGTESTFFLEPYTPGWYRGRVNYVDCHYRFVFVYAGGQTYYFEQNNSTIDISKITLQGWGDDYLPYSQGQKIGVGTKKPITLDYNASVEIENETYEAAVVYGSKLNVIPTRDGWAFDGWYTNPTDGTRVTSGTSISNTTLYAHWSKSLADCTTVVDYSGTYDGKSHSFTLDTDPKAIVLYTYQDENGNQHTDETEKPFFTKAGTYTITYNVSKAECTPVNGEVTVKINPKQITAPANISTAKTYTGKEIIAFQETDNYTVSNGSATDPGSYTATFILKDPVNTEWTTGGTANKTATWSIASPSTPSMTATFSQDSITKTMTTNKDTIPASELPTLEISEASTTVKYYCDKTWVATVNSSTGAVTPVYDYGGVVEISATVTKSGYGTVVARYYLTIKPFEQSSDGKLVITGGTYKHDPTDNVAPGYHAEEDNGLWTVVPNVYTIVFNANGGSGSMNSMQLSYEEEKTLNTNTFTRTGYKFLGWSTDSNAEVKEYDDGASVKKLTTENNLDVTLYAVWKDCDHSNNDFTYEISSSKATEAKIEKICTCGEKGILTLKGESVWYDAQSHNAQVTISGSTEISMNSYSISYSKKNGSDYEAVGSVVEPGKYKAEVVLDQKNEKKISVKYEILNLDNWNVDWYAGQVFKNKDSTNDKNISISDKGSATLQISTGDIESTGYYQSCPKLIFKDENDVKQNLPKNTKIIMKNSDGYCYYNVEEDSISSLKLTEFKIMGSNSNYVYSFTNQETYHFVFDFSNVGNIAGNKLKVELQYQDDINDVPTLTLNSGILEFKDESITLNKDASQNNVIQINCPDDDSGLNGRGLVLDVTLNNVNNGNIPEDILLTASSIVSGNEIVVKCKADKNGHFYLPLKYNDQTVSLSVSSDSYHIEQKTITFSAKLYLSAGYQIDSFGCEKYEDTNKSVSGTVALSGKRVLSLKITGEKRILKKGQDDSFTVTVSAQNNDGNITRTIQKSTGEGETQQLDDMTQPGQSTIPVSELDIGSYRLKAKVTQSDGTSLEVYYYFIVE